MSFGSKELDRAFDRWITQTPEEYHGYEEDVEYDGDFSELNEQEVNMKIENCKKGIVGEKKEIMITARISINMDRFMKENNLSPTAVFSEALKALGFK